MPTARAMRGRTGIWLMMIPQTNARAAAAVVSAGRSGRSDRDTLGAVPGNRLGHEARGLHLLDERAQEPRRGLATLRRANRLLDRRELPGENARAGKLLDVGQESRLEPR